MITKVFEFSVAAGAAAVNLMPSDFNPVPSDGVLDISAMLDAGIAGLTAPPTVAVRMGGAASECPVETASITGSPYGVPPANSFADPINPVLTAYPVRAARNIQLLVAGGTGAVATGRFRVTFRTAAEVSAGTMG